jgi:hypothetical protein
MLLLALYAAEASLAFLFTASARAAQKEGMRAFLQSAPGLAAIGALAILVASLIVLVRLRNAGLLRAIALNLASVGLALGGAEAALRLLARATPDGEAVAGTTLYPRDWGKLARGRLAALERHDPATAFLVPDAELGWVPGPSRVSPDGLYASSAEGARAPSPGTLYAEAPAARRIALVGDSYTFCKDVPFEESWGALLERALGDGWVVMNFGVDGYGVDQAFLRYRRDARPLAPRVALFGVFPHDLLRTMTVHVFLEPEWDIPFSKCRFVETADGVAPVNLPLPDPRRTLALASASELPFRDLDLRFHEAEWERPWYAFSYALRFVRSRFSPWPARRPGTSEQALCSLNAALLREFGRLARADGAVPLVVYLPARRDFTGREADRRQRTFDLSVLARSGLDVVDLTGVVGAVPEAERFFSDASPGAAANARRHYTPRANAAIAKRLAAEVAGRTG